MTHLAISRLELTAPTKVASLASPTAVAAALTRWSLQDAKNQLSALVREARAHGPQRITVHGTDTVVVIAVEDYERLTGGTMNLVEALRRSPLGAALAAGEITIERTRDAGRDIEL